MDSLSMATSLLSAGLGLLVVAVLLLRKKNKRYPPVAGSIIHQLINAPRLHHYLTELAYKYRTYRILDLFKFAVYTIDPANVEYILKTNFANYGKGEFLHSIMSDVLGDGIFTVDGNKWLHQRKASASQLSTSVLRNYSSEFFRTNAVKLAGIISEAVTRDESIEIQDLFVKATLDSIVKLLLGIDLGTLCGTNTEETIQFSNAFDDANEASLYRIADKFWKIERFLNIGKESVIRSNVQVVDQFIYKLIYSKIEAAKSAKNEQSVRKRDFVSRLLETADTDPKYLRDLILSVTVAGKDTTAYALSWFIYMMCRHLSVQEKVAQEVREATNLNNNSSADQVAAKLTEEVLKKMQYLHAALSETLRLYPSVPMDARICFSDDTLPDGNSVKKGEMVVYQPYGMGRMKFLWGDDAEEFKPERWLDKNGNFQDESPFKFIAFNAGPKICLGKDYAYMQMKIFAAVLLSNYKFKLSDEGKSVTYKTSFTLRIDGGLYVHASPRLA